MGIDLGKYPLDDEVMAYLDRCEALYPASNGKLDVETNRALYLSMCDAFQAEIPESVQWRDEEIAGRHGAIPVRWYKPAESAMDVRVVYFHGGGFVVGNLDSHHSLCAEIAAETGCTVIAVDYRLAPEHAHPVPFEDALDAFYALDNGNTIVAGDSAGGTLSAAIALATRGRKQRPVGQVLIYPWLGGELLKLDSYQRNCDAPGLTVQDLAAYRALRTVGEPDLTDTTYYPLAASRYDELPPCVALAAEFDPLCDDADAWIGRLRAAKVPALSYLDHGLIHGHLRARHMSDKVTLSFRRICDSIRCLADGSLPDPQ